MLAATILHTVTGALTPRAPFDFAKTHGFLHGFSPTAGEQRFDVGSVTKAVTINGRAVAFEVSSAGTIEEPRLVYTLSSERPLSEAEHAAVADRMGFFLSVDDDLRPFYTLGRADPTFAPVIERFYGLHHPKFLTPFEIACWAVLGQRIPMRLAHRIKLTLVERWGTSITLPDGETYRAFPEPSQLAAVAPDDLLAVVRNERKVDYLQAVIDFFSQVDEPFLRSGPYDEIAARLRGIRGIGEWSSHFILVRGLGRMERVSTVDGELLKAASTLYNQGQPLDSAAMSKLLDYYGSTQGYWAYYTRIAPMERFQEVGL
jgi:DNA-3-methyladenine glycosylase II